MNIDWDQVLAAERAQPYYQQMLAQISDWRAAGQAIYPPESQVFVALERTPLDKVRVVILGQDPYHGEGQAHGLSFSVAKGVKLPPSLVNIYKELATDIEGFQVPVDGDLSRWADQGVLLLNTVLTVNQGHAHSHAKLGWEQFTDAVVAAVNQHCQNVVFILWGAHAQKKGRNIDATKHLLLNGPHPSPLSAYRGFFGCRHFSKTNHYLLAQGYHSIDWQP
ncbi:uracil-DNA glycosylase [Ferrimonas senticii]|uniref:uracil-DNA glycosylase n=1 Tax=Ferrimonas senticii TaxID=394566 RepID=UPI000402CE94|nr:uracil-DNA glycosylase [Ferrimonas senticii]